MRQTDLSGNLPRWSDASTTKPDPIARFRAQLTTLLSRRLKKGQTIDDTEARTILAAASQIMNEDAWR